MMCIKNYWKNDVNQIQISVPSKPEGEGQYVTDYPQIDCDERGDACKDSKKQFVIQVDKAYLCDNSNGAILERGIIVAQLEDGSK